MIGGHPRPQLVRDGYSVLDGVWDYRIDPTDNGLAERWYEGAVEFGRSIRVPFPPEALASGIGEEADCPIWYRRDVELFPKPGTRQLLHFEGVDHRATVWLNGVHLLDHEGSQTRFSCDVTEAARPGVNVLVVRAIDERANLEQPRGKQDWQPEPHVIWYRRTSGIWRTVWHEEVPATRIDRLHLQPLSDLRSFAFKARLAGAPLATARLRVTVRLGEYVLADVETAVIGDTAQATIILQHDSLDAEPTALLWSPDSPTLLDVAVTLTDGRQTIDTVGSYLGLRTIEARDGRILLNGRPLYLRLVLEQAYWPHTHLASPSREALEDEARLIRSLGFNGLRMHQVSADPRFLEACDRLGLVVLADVAAAYRFSSTALRRTAVEMMSLVERDINHPSLIGWVPFNESWGLPQLQVDGQQQHAVKAAFHLLKSLDPSRLAIGNDGWHWLAGDIVGIHDYTQDPATLARRYGTRRHVLDSLPVEQPAGRPLILGSLEDAIAAPVLLTEFGGISAHSDPTAWSAYGEVTEATRLATSVGRLVAALGSGDGIAGFCYTQLTDTEQEKNGLLTAERLPKCRLPDLWAAIRGEPAPTPSSMEAHDALRDSATN